MFQSHYVPDHFGNYYRLCNSSAASSLSAQPLSWLCEHSATRFVRTLRAPAGLWNSLVFSSYGLLGERGLPHNCTVEQRVAALIVRGKLRVYAVPSPQVLAEKSRLATFTKDERHTWRVTAAGATDTASGPVRTFQSHQEAAAFLKQLSPSGEQLQAMVDLNPKLAGQAASQETVADALVSGDIAVVEEPIQNLAPTPEGSPSSQSAEDSAETSSPAPLGPHEAGATPAANPKEETAEEPVCELVSFRVFTASGREALVNSKSKTAPKLALVASQTHQPGLKRIAAEIQANALCGSHQESNFKINKDHRLKSRSSTSIALDVCCEAWNTSNAFERVWLPSVTPKTYRVTTKDTCQTPDISVRSVEIDVYPDITWEWDTQINFGKLKFVPGKAQVEYSDLGIDGNVKLTYDGKAHDLKEKYKEYITDPLESFRKICDSISKVLEAINDPTTLMRIGTKAKNPPPEEGQDNTDGNETRLALTWPNLDIKYHAILAENQQVDLVDHDYRISVAANPLLDIDIQVDVLDTLMKVAPAGTSKLIAFAKERIEQGFESNNTKFRGELDVIFTARSTINITEGEISGRHNVLGPVHTNSVAAVVTKKPPI
jgi:hypothetical protein